MGQFRALIDESSALRGDRQEYLICAALVETSDCEAEHRKKVERYRRKCLEVVYHELRGMGVTDAALEHRSRAQDAADRAHIVALKAQSLDHSLRITHPKGGEEPLLWIANAVRGAITSRHLGIREHYEALAGTLCSMR